MAFEQKETRLHCAAVRYLRVTCPDCIVFHVGNGGKRSKETARLMQALGVTAGVFDLILIGPDGRHFYLEAKSDKGRLSEAQKWSKKELILRGIPYAIFRSLDDIKNYHSKSHPEQNCRARSQDGCRT